MPLLKLHFSLLKYSKFSMYVNACTVKLGYNANRSLLLFILLKPCLAVIFKNIF